MIYFFQEKARFFAQKTQNWAQHCQHDGGLSYSLHERCADPKKDKARLIKNFDTNNKKRAAKAVLFECILSSILQAMKAAKAFEAAPMLAPSAHGRRERGRHPNEKGKPEWMPQEIGRAHV